MVTLEDPKRLRRWSRGVGVAVLSAFVGDLVAAGENHYLTPPPPISTKGLSREERAIVRAFERVNRAVVVILTEETEIVDEEGEARLEPGKGIGSGVVISDQGDILTAAHVVTGARNAKARLLDGSKADVSIIFSDTASDIAFVRLVGEHPAVPFAELGDSDRVQTGQTALVVGAPLGAENSLSVGHISARRKGDEFFGGAVVADMLQTDAAVNRGNSGGPLVNLNGEVIGIISRILTTTGGSQGLGFAVASNTIKELLGEKPVPWIGVNTLFLDPELTRALHIPSEGALLVQSVVEGSPAERAGIRGGNLPAILGKVPVVLGGDVILAIDDQRTCHRDCILHEIHAQAEATVLTLTLWREGQQVRMEIPVQQPHILKPRSQAASPGVDE